MKVWVIVALSLMAFGQAIAKESNMNLQSRFSMKSFDADESKNQAGEKNYSAFEAEWVYLGMAGKVNDQLSYDLVLNPVGTNATNTTNNTQNLLHVAKLDYDLGAGLSLTVGKMGVLYGGRENEHDDIDQFITSEAVDTFTVTEVGAQLNYALGDHTFHLQMVNGEENTDSQKNYGMAVAMYGSFMDKMIEPILAYNQKSKAGVEGVDSTIGLGTRINFAPIVAEVDYYMVTREDNTLNADGTTTSHVGKDDEINSLVALVQYDHAMFKPFVKMTMDSAESYDVNGVKSEQDNMKYALGLEYYPNSDRTFGAHLVYTTDDVEVKTAGVTRDWTTNTIYAGIKTDFTL